MVLNANQIYNSSIHGLALNLPKLKSEPLLDSARPIFYTSPSTTGGKKVRDTYRYRELAKKRVEKATGVEYQKGRNGIAAADIYIELGDRSYVQGMEKAGDENLALARAILDEVLGEFVPGFSRLESLYSIVSRKNPITGETLSENDVITEVVKIFLPDVSDKMKDRIRTMHKLIRGRKSGRKFDKAYNSIVDLLEKGMARFAP
jgi:hypothetical protein